MALLVVLFNSFVSATAPVASASARMYQVPGAVPAGMVTAAVEPALLAPDARMGMLRLLSRTSVISQVVSVER